MSARRLTLKNTSGETAPAFAIAEVAGALPVPEGGGAVDGASVLEIRKPTGTGRVVAVGPAAIEDERYGKGFAGDCFARFTGSDPSPGDTLHATSGSWALSAGGTGTGVTVAGDVRDMGTYKIVRVEIGGGSGSGGGDIRRVRVYDNLAGASVDTEGKIVVPTVRGLYETAADGGGWEVDTEADYIVLEPASGVIIELAESGCCGDATDAGGGLRIMQPIMGTNLVTDATDEAVTIRVSGVPRTNSVTVTISGAGDTDQVISGIYPGADGICTVGLFDVTGFDKGVLKVEAQAFEPGAVALPARYAALPYAKGDDTAALLLHNNGLPLEPELQAASDTGASDTDGYTDDDTPTFDTYPNVPSEASGPAAYLYANGDLVASGDEADFDVTPFAVNVGTPLADGVYDFQLVLVYIDTFGTTPAQNYYGPASLPTRVVIVDDADAGAGTDDAECYMRRGLASTVDGVLTLIRIDSCPSPMSAAEQAKFEAV